MLQNVNESSDIIFKHAGLCIPYRTVLNSNYLPEQACRALTARTHNAVEKKSETIRLLHRIYFSSRVVTSYFRKGSQPTGKKLLCSAGASKSSFYSRTPQQSAISSQPTFPTASNVRWIDEAQKISKEEDDFASQMCKDRSE
jgi:hypothetical protein